MAVIAVVFDFDDTLVPDSTTALLESRGVDAAQFWSELIPPLIGRGYDPPMAYLRLLLDRIGQDQPLGMLNNEDLRAFGASLDSKFYPGLPQMFLDLREIVSGYRDISIEFYIVSGGLQEVIAGSQTVKEHFAGFYGCQLDEGADGAIRYVKRCVTFTEKTRYIFEINKGVPFEESRKNPMLVNNRADQRRIPFKHMIYVGDGLTDIPCFSLIRERGGWTFGVWSPNKSPKQAFQDLLQQRRVDSLHSPDYQHDADLGAMIRAAVETLVASIELDTEQA